MNKRIYHFTYGGTIYSLNITKGTVKNEITGAVQAIDQLRSMGLIWAAQSCLEKAEREWIYSNIENQLITNLSNEKTIIKQYVRQEGQKS